MRSVILIGMSVLLSGAAFARAQPTTHPSENGQSTLDVLKDIDKEAAQPHPAMVRESASPMSAVFRDIPARYRPSLIVVWPGMLVALAIAGGITGLFMVLRREALVALSLPQVVVLGAAIGLKLSWPAKMGGPTLAPMLLTVALALVLIAWWGRARAAAYCCPRFTSLASVSRSC